MRSSNDDRRKLLIAVLAGDIEALRTYKTQMQNLGDPLGVIIDAREVGGPITLINPEGEARELTPEEFDRLPEHSRKNRVTIIDTTNGNHVPAPDEDYYIE